MKQELYDTFMTEVIPRVQEGLVITQEYFTDLFGRYITYLIVTDIMAIATVLAIFGISIWLMKVLIKKGTEKDWEPEYSIGIISILVINGVVAVPLLLKTTTDLVKVIYIPEVRIYEEIKRMR